MSYKVEVAPGSTVETVRSQSEQLSLLPEDLGLPRFEFVDLDVLPASEDLISEQPTKARISTTERFGIVEPIILIERSEPQSAQDIYKIEAGIRRVKLARLAHLKAIPAMIFQEGYIFPGAIALLENYHRDPNPAREIRIIDEMMKSGLTVDIISENLAIPKASIGDILKLHKLIPGLRELMDEGRIDAGVSRACSRLKTEQQEKALAIYNAVKILTLKDIKEIKKAEAKSARETLFTGDDGDEEDDDSWNSAQVRRAFRELIRGLNHYMAALPESERGAAAQALGTARQEIADSVGEETAEAMFGAFDAAVDRRVYVDPDAPAPANDGDGASPIPTGWCIGAAVKCCEQAGEFGVECSGDCPCHK